MKITFSRDFLVSAMCLLANMLVLCSTPYITPYLIPKYQLFTGLGLLVLLYVSFKYIQHFSIRNIWDKIIVFSIFVSFCHGLLTYCFYFDENGVLVYGGHLDVVMTIKGRALNLIDEELDVVGMTDDAYIIYAYDIHMFLPKTLRKVMYKKI